MSTPAGGPAPAGPAGGGPAPRTGPDRTATALLRLGLDPATGRLLRPRPLTVGLRAALLADLALAGAVVDEFGSPVAAGPPPDDRVLAAVHAAVARRPHVSWHRWFRHVEADRDVLVAELVEAGTWTGGGRIRPAYVDVQPGQVAALRGRAVAVARGAEVPSTPAEAVLGVLVGLTGVDPTVSTRHDRAQVAALLPDVPDGPRQAVVAAVVGARLALRGSVIGRAVTRRRP